MTGILFQLVCFGWFSLNLYNPVNGSENLSLLKSSRQSSIFVDFPNWGAERAVDGQLDQNLARSQCSVTAFGENITEAWWQVDLGQASFLQSIRILLRNDDGDTSRSRMAGYALYISDESEILSGQLCYRHTESEGLPPFEILQTCNLIGRYLTVYLNRTGPQPPGWSADCILILCEVQALGCPVGRYGNLNCNANCSVNCVNNTLCDPNNGTCIGECDPGWKGATCDSICDSDTFGTRCNSTCTAQCLNGSCHHVTGMCPDGLCAAGYESPNCSSVCEPGTYGIKCGEICSDNCRYNPCDHVNGSCPLGACMDGWLGDKCDIKCGEGKYGPGCELNCSSNCLNGTCHPVTGACTFCNAGTKGFNCTEECDPGSHGYFCREQCSFHCVYQPCNYINGSCPFGKCNDGWTGDKCSDVCEEGFFGRKCNNTCGNCVDNAVCNHVTGNCPGKNPKCEAGFSGAQCKTGCGINTFGADCAGSCGRCLNVRTCNPVNGSCPFGCQNGWEGTSCEINTLSIGQSSLVDNAGIIVGAIAGVLVLIVVLVAVIYLNRKTIYKNQKGSTLRRLKSSYVTFDEDSTSIDNIGSRRMKRRSRGDNLEVALGREGSGKITEEHKRVSHFISDLYAVVDKPKSNKEQHIVVIRKQQKENSANTIIRESNSKSKTEHHYDSGDLAVADDNIYNEADDISKDIHKEGIYEELEEEQTTKSTENLVPEAPMSKIPERKNSQVSERSNSQKKVEKNKELERSNSLKKVEKDKTSTVEQNQYLDMSSTTFSKTSIKLEDLRTVMYQKLTDKIFDNEFQSLPEGDIHPNDAGKKQDNKTKNRFATVLPYDHSRVILEPIQGDTASTDYINASYIDGIQDPKTYIATQGPKKSTIRDFWRMIWQKQVGKIVMVTDFIEAGKVKCAKYWLEPGINMKISVYLVTVEEEREYAFYTVRKFKLVDTQKKKAREVLHFHFTMWPDHGTPDPLQLVLFQQQVSKATAKVPGPMVVHCSAGLGRTGTFISLDALLKNGWKSGFVDIFEYVKTMRQSRPNMVQTADQYFIIHRALLEGFRLENTTILKDSFLQTWEEMQKSDTPANRKKIRDEFQKLDYLRPEYDEGVFTSAHHAENVTKNRRMSVLPVDRYRPLLTTPAPGRNDYINAVMIPSYTKPVGFLVTQFPLPDTVVDVWRLIYDHESSMIISLGAIDNVEQQGSVVPSMSETYNVGPYVVKKCSKKNISRDITEIEILVTNKETKVDKNIKLVEVKTWNQGEHLPPNKSLVMSLIEITQDQRKLSSSGPVTIMCPDGAVCCGIICSFCNCVERLEIDNEVDVFQTVRQLNTRRPEFISKLEQYGYCYDLVKEYLYPRDMYANT